MKWVVWGQSHRKGSVVIGEVLPRSIQKHLNNGPLVVHNGEHQTNLMVSFRIVPGGKTSAGQSSLVRSTWLPVLLH